MAAILVVGLIVIRLTVLEMPATFIIGMYLPLSKLGPFAEESYRGEAQTPSWSGMRVYRQITILTIVVGADVTCIPSAAMSIFDLSSQSLVWATAMGAFAIVAYGLISHNQNSVLLN